MIAFLECTSAMLACWMIMRRGLIQFYLDLCRIRWYACTVYLALCVDGSCTGFEVAQQVVVQVFYCVAPEQASGGVHVHYVIVCKAG